MGIYIALTVGLMLGSIFGYGTCAIMTVAKEADRRSGIE